MLYISRRTKKIRRTNRRNRRQRNEGIRQRSSRRVEALTKEIIKKVSFGDGSRNR